MTATRKIGDVEVTPIGLGGMPLSIDGRPDHDQALATVLAAIDAGVTLIDTADSYTTEAEVAGHNESLIAEALALRPTEAKNILVATKGGLIYKKDRPWDRNGKPEYLRAAAIASAKRLGVESIGLYQYHREDYTTAYTDSLGAMKDLLDEGLVQMVGISNAITEQIELFNQILDGRLVSVQNRFSPIFQSSRPELDYTVEHGMAFLPYSPLGGIGRGDVVFNDSAFAEVGAELGVSPQQVALAWELSLGETVIPIPGASKSSSIEDSVRAADLVLSADHLARLNAS
jgi:aryl-alcohol dehydrogenase-like predicted oxidoreductase